MLKLGLIGLDTSHVLGFTRYLNDPEVDGHVPGGRIVAGFPGGSPDLPVSADRVFGFTKELRETFGVEILDSPEAVAQSCDAVFITSVDGRVHLEQLRAVAPFGKPVFIDKPFATSMADAEAMAKLAREQNLPLMSCSSLRFAEAFQSALGAGENPIGLDVYGPMPVQAQQPGLFWYGVHIAEMLVAALGTDFAVVSGLHQESQDLVTVNGEASRIGTLRGTRAGNGQFGGMLHFAEKREAFAVGRGDRPLTVTLLERVLPFFRGEANDAPADQAVAVTRLMVEANRLLGYS